MRRPASGLRARSTDRSPRPGGGPGFAGRRGTLLLRRSARRACQTLSPRGAEGTDVAAENSQRHAPGVRPRSARVRPDGARLDAGVQRPPPHARVGDSVRPDALVPGPRARGGYGDAHGADPRTVSARAVDRHRPLSPDDHPGPAEAPSVPGPGGAGRGRLGGLRGGSVRCGGLRARDPPPPRRREVASLPPGPSMPVARWILRGRRRPPAGGFDLRYALRPDCVDASGRIDGPGAGRLPPHRRTLAILRPSGRVGLSLNRPTSPARAAPR